MTTFNQATLEQLKEQAITKYKNSTHGYDAYADTCPKTARAIGRMVVGAEVVIPVPYQTELIATYIEYSAKGYTYHPAGTIPINTTGSVQFHMWKPEAPQVVHGKEVRIEGVEYQCDDIKKILTEVESTYKAVCEAVDKAAALAEEARILAEVTAQVDAEIEQERQARIEAAKAERGQRIQAAIKPAKKAAK
jgi:hypothetical protein